MTLGDPGYAINMVKVKSTEQNRETFPLRTVSMMDMNKTQELEKSNNLILRDGDNFFCNSSIVVPVGQVNSKLASCPTSYLQAPLPKPSPAVSNRGLVIVQVQNEQQSSAYRPVLVYDSVLKTYSSEKDEKENLANKTGSEENIKSNVEIIVDPSAASHQLIHGYPPHTFLPEDEEEEEEEAEDEMDDPEYSQHDESDEGYRTNSSVASGSPSISSIESPAPVDEGCVVSKKQNDEVVTGQIGERVEDEHGNLMWLVDFKLDFLSDIEKEGESGKLSIADNFIDVNSATISRTASHQRASRTLQEKNQAEC